MKNILLICSAGMSTSIVVQKMQESAKERGIEANIWAVGDADRADNMPKADIIMLGPQVRFLQPKIEKESGKKVVVIDMRDYGMLRGDKILDHALEELGE